MYALRPGLRNVIKHKISTHSLLAYNLQPKEESTDRAKGLTIQRKLIMHKIRTNSFLAYNSRAILKKTKLRGLSPRSNYTDRAAAAGRRS